MSGVVIVTKNTSFRPMPMAWCSLTLGHSSSMGHSSPGATFLILDLLLMFHPIIMYIFDSNLYMSTYIWKFSSQSEAFLRMIDWILISVCDKSTACWGVAPNTCFHLTNSLAVPTTWVIACWRQALFSQFCYTCFIWIIQLFSNIVLQIQIDSYIL